MSAELKVRSIAHVFGVFSHYGPKTGSALVTKVYQHARALEESGGTAYVLVNEARDASYDAGTTIRFSSPREGAKEWFTRRERRIDAMMGALIGQRPMQAKFWKPALKAVPGDAEALVVYNQPAALPSKQQSFPSQLKILHLGNDVFRTWRPRHIERSLREFDLVVAVSSFTAASINRRISGLGPRVEVLRNGVDVNAFHPAEAGTVPDPEVLFVGNPVPHKGAHHLLAAARLLAERGLDFRLRIVGSWGLSEWHSLTEYEAHLRDLAKPLGDRVIFQPFADRNTIAKVFRRARVFCMPVEWDEPAGQVVTEAMASGLPVVSSRRGGIPEYLGPAGSYIEPSDSQALARALEVYLKDHEKAREDGLALRLRSESMTWLQRVGEFDSLMSSYRERATENR